MHRPIVFLRPLGLRLATKHEDRACPRNREPPKPRHRTTGISDGRNRTSVRRKPRELYGQGESQTRQDCGLVVYRAQCEVLAHLASRRSRSSVRHVGTTGLAPTGVSSLLDTATAGRRRRGFPHRGTLWLRKQLTASLVPSNRESVVRYNSEQWLGQVVWLLRKLRLGPRRRLRPTWRAGT